VLYQVLVMKICDVCGISRSKARNATKYIYDTNCSRRVSMSRCAEQLQSLEIGGSAAPKTSNSIILPALRVFLGNKKALPHIRTCAPIQSGSIWDAPRTNALLERCLGLQGKRNKERENARSDLDRADVCRSAAQELAEAK
jgi:hypothetical protein